MVRSGEAGCLQAVSQCDLVFLDPDNGLEVPSVPITSPLAGKYGTVAEMAALLHDRAGVVLYQHGSRTTWPEQRKRICAQITAGNDRPVTIRTLRFGAYGARAFFCVSTCPRLTEAVARGLDVLRRRAEGWDKSAYLLFE